MRLRRHEQVGSGEEKVQLGDGIVSLCLYAQERQADLGEDRVGESVSVPAPVDLKALHAKIGELALENDFLEGALTKAGLLSAKR